MKKTFLILFVLLTLSGEAIHGQSQPSASLLQGIGSQIEKKMQRFLTIIEIVGTYSSVPQQEKLTMITEDAPALFWDYGHRSMVVTSRNCPGGRSKPVAEYLRQLRIQSRFVSAAPLYNCRLLSSYGSASAKPANWRYEGTKEGVKVYSFQVAYHQDYRLVDGQMGWERSQTIISESETKKMMVYLLVAESADRRPVRIVRLGDVTGSVREKAINDKRKYYGKQ